MLCLSNMLYNLCPYIYTVHAQYISHYETGTSLFCVVLFATSVHWVVRNFQRPKYYVRIHSSVLNLELSPNVRMYCLVIYVYMYVCSLLQLEV